MRKLEQSLLADKWNKVKEQIPFRYFSEEFIAIDTFMGNLTEGCESIEVASDALFTPRTVSDGTVKEIMDYSKTFDELTENEDVIKASGVTDETQIEIKEDVQEIIIKEEVVDDLKPLQEIIVDKLEANAVTDDALEEKKTVDEIMLETKECDEQEHSS